MFQATNLRGRHVQQILFSILGDWPPMKTYIENIIRFCQNCLRHNDMAVDCLLLVIKAIGKITFPDQTNMYIRPVNKNIFFGISKNAGQFYVTFW